MFYDVWCLDIYEGIYLYLLCVDLEKGKRLRVDLKDFLDKLNFFNLEKNLKINKEIKIKKF